MEANSRNEVAKSSVRLCYRSFAVCALLLVFLARMNEREFDERETEFERKQMFVNSWRKKHYRLYFFRDMIIHLGKDIKLIIKTGFEDVNNI